MDIIESLSGQLGLDPRQAQALAGAVLGAARDESADEETAKLEQAVPELDQWASVAQSMLSEGGADDGDSGGGGLLGSLAKMAGSGLGNELVGAVLGEDAQETATLVAVMNKLGLDTSHATMAAPVVLEFLENRLGDEWTERIVKGAPMLMGLIRTQGAEGAQTPEGFGLGDLMSRILKG
ncbi:MAG: DUF2780 domain-containing protein [Myxococcales bacterium]|nr:DUF2780 domain-containing protein [Myxococcales bacterium]